MSLIDLFPAIDARWNANNLDASITGGITAGSADDAKMPYCVFNVLGTTVRTRSSSGDAGAGEYTATTVEFALHGNTGLGPIGALVKTLRAAFDNATLTLGAGEGSVLYMRYLTDIPVQNPDSQYRHVWRYVVTYEILRRRDESNMP